MIEPRGLEDGSAPLADATAEVGGGDRRPVERWAAVAVTLVALAPIIVAIVTRAGRSYLPVQDFAVIDLRVRDVFSHDIPLVGPYSRYGWDHPGPLVYWLVGPFAAVFGSPAWATQVGFAILQGVAVTWTSILAWRRRGLWAVTFWLAVTTVSFLATGEFAILEPWGPNVALPFFVLFCCQVWLVGGDDIGVLPQAAAVGTFLVQTHVGYAPLVAAGALFTVPALRRAAAGRWPAIAKLRPVRWAAAIAVVLWLPALVETVLHPPGNLAKVADRTLLHGSSPKIGVGSAIGLLAGPFRLVPGWLGGNTPYDALGLTAVPASAAWLLAPAVLLAGAGWLARRAGDHDGGKLIALIALLYVAGLVALASVQGDSFPYLFYWREPLAAMTVFGAVVVVIRWIARRRPAVAYAVPVLGAAVVLLAAVPVAQKVATSPEVFDRFGNPTRVLIDQLEAAGEPKGPVLVRFAGTALGGVHGGIVDELSRRGRPIKVDESVAYQYGHDRTASPEQVEAIWYVVEESDVVSLLSAHPEARVIAQYQPLSPDEHERLTTLQRKLAGQVLEAGRGSQIPALATPLVAFTFADVPGIDHAELDELAALNEKVERAACECAVIALPPSYRGEIP